MNGYDLLIIFCASPIIGLLDYMIFGRYIHLYHKNENGEFEKQPYWHWIIPSTFEMLFFICGYAIGRGLIS